MVLLLAHARRQLLKSNTGQQHKFRIRWRVQLYRQIFSDNFVHTLKAGSVVFLDPPLCSADKWLEMWVPQQTLVSRAETTNVYIIGIVIINRIDG